MWLCACEVDVPLGDQCRVEPEFIAPPFAEAVDLPFPLTS